MSGEAIKRLGEVDKEMKAIISLLADSMTRPNAERLFKKLDSIMVSCDTIESMFGGEEVEISEEDRERGF